MKKDKDFLESGIAYILWMFGFFIGFPVLHRLYMGKLNFGTFLRCIPGLGHFLSFLDLFSIPAEIEDLNFKRAYKRQLMKEGVFLKPESPTKEKLEKIVLHVAKKNKGIISAGDFALEADLTLSEAKKILDEFTKNGLIEIRVKRSGVVVYTFPDFLDNGQDNELLDI